MCSPDVPPMPDPPTVKVPVDEAVVQSMKDRRRKARLRAGLAGTILTGGGGLDEPVTHQTSLLGG